MKLSRVIALTALLVSAASIAQDKSSVVISTHPVDPSSIKPALPAGHLKLPLEVDIDAAQTFIRLGFGLDESIRFQSTQLLTPRLRTVQAQQLIAMVESYNNFEGKQVAAALAEFRGKISAIEFGREGSPVLYIELPYWTHQREEVSIWTEGQKIPDAENESLVQRLKQVFVGGLLADEFSAEGRRVRIWWD